MVVGRGYGITGRDLVDLFCGAMLHDIGKIGVPDAVLLKKGSLTPEERAVMEKHPEIGYGIISHIGYLSAAAEIIRSHHEHFDGTGYPRGLRGAEIPVGARVFAVADTLDALTVERPYRKAVSFDEASEKVLALRGTLFDPRVVDTFTGSSEELRDLAGKIVI